MNPCLFGIYLDLFTIFQEDPRGKRCAANAFKLTCYMEIKMKLSEFKISTRVFEDREYDEQKYEYIDLFDR